MKLRYYLFTLGFSLCLLTKVSAQSPDEHAQVVKTYDHRLGLSAVELLERISGNSEENGRDYLITYRYDLGKMQLRAGINPALYYDEVRYDGFQDRQDSLFTRLNLRLGIGFELLDNAGWEINAGFDLVGQYALEESTDDSGFDKVTRQRKSKGAGIGPFISFNYRLSNRLSLGTEAAVYGMYRETTRTINFENFPDFNDELDTKKEFELQTNMPSTIYFQFHF